MSIIFVLLAHLTSTKNFPQGARFLNFGGFGVRIFFVISGYLITLLLLKELDDTGTLSLRKFYFRRVLRLFPAAYAMIALVAILSPVSRGDLIAALTYTMNYRSLSHIGWNLGHLWSLAVEEQFYLLWPPLLLWLRPRRAVNLLIGCMCVAPVCRYAYHYFGTSFNFLITSDALAAGCLLALLHGALWANRRYRRVIESRWFFAVPILALGLNYIPFSKIKYIETIINVATAMTIDWAIRNHDVSLVGRLLNLRAVRAVGVLSYSLYLWQQPFLNRASSATICAFPVNILLVATLAMLSYYGMERPFLRLRERLEMLHIPHGCAPDAGRLEKAGAQRAASLPQ